jgi:hypothetical protein
MTLLVESKVSGSFLIYQSKPLTRHFLHFTPCYDGSFSILPQMNERFVDSIHRPLITRR